MNDLIARLEAATGPDRELDIDVLVACGWRDEREFGFLADLQGEHYWIGNPDCWNGEPPFVTGSLDAAMTLVPEGSAYNFQGNSGMHYACVSGFYSGKAAPTPAIALAKAAIAALRARASDGGR
ncbi:MAG TPA: hypothetical protein VNQ99_06285 [Xanthobacteraceae bacterium]|nr:hypothetical protein [Xanthobacteraceae bacterium]